MGQGQADVALAALRDCSRNGEWLCLKNLHLVTAWLPLLEKVSIPCEYAAERRGSLEDVLQLNYACNF